MVATVVRQPDGLIVGLKHRLKRVFRLRAVFVDLNRPVVDLGHGNDLNMIPEASVLSFPVDISVHVLSDILFKVVRVFSLFKNH